jgi:transglutaminase-like putative cysteine protease
VSVGRWTLDRATAVRLAAFALLAALAAAQWMRLIEQPPAGRVALAVGVLVVGATLIAALAARRPSRAAGVTLATLAALLAVAAGLAAVGVPVRLLEPGSWGALARELGAGFAGLTGEVEYPYGGANEWTRIVILAGLPVALGLAAALAFRPGDSPRARRIAPLVVLVATFGVGATVAEPAEPLLWGLLLMVAIAAWLWLPSLRPREVLAGAAFALAAGVAAMPLAAALDHQRPWIDFREWQLGRDAPNTFDWNHSYGPIDWPREGTAVVALESEHSQYWKTAVLDEFDGRRWLRSERSTTERAELPTQVEGGHPGATLQQPHSEWIETIDVTIGPLQSQFVLGAGELVTVQGLDGIVPRPDGSTLVDEPLGEGDSYSAVAYVPNPSPRQLRAAPDRYPSVLSRYTEITLPGRPEPAEQQFVTPAPFTTVQVPLRGSADRASDRAASRAIATSPYAPTLRLVRSLTAGAPTAYAAARAIERHLQTGFTYNENPPRHHFPLNAFLFEDRFGYCQQFSGAMALMLRMAGIPSRVATGFSPGTPDPEEKHRYIVEDRDAHSWVESYFPTIGWVTFDPTPPSAPAAGRTTGVSLTAGFGDLDLSGIQGAARKEFLPGRGAVTAADSSSGSSLPAWTIPAAIAALALLALAAIAIASVARRLRYARLTPAERAAAHLRELPTALVRLGWPVAPSETLLALERRLYSYRKDAAAHYVAKLRAGRFTPTSDGTPTLAERQGLRDNLSSLGGLRSRLRGLFALPPGGPTR